MVIDNEQFYEGKRHSEDSYFYANGNRYDIKENKLTEEEDGQGIKYNVL